MAQQIHDQISGLGKQMGAETVGEMHKRKGTVESGIRLPKKDHLDLYPSDPTMVQNESGPPVQQA